jgi:hypothetical protein
MISRMGHLIAISWKMISKIQLRMCVKAAGYSYATGSMPKLQIEVMNRIVLV